MAIPITLELVESVYNMLRETPPFKRWKLPDVDSVHITINASIDKAGEYRLESDDTHHILISSRHHETLNSLIVTTAHEMCHLYEVLKGARHDVKHSSIFRRAADSICKHHKFDRLTF